MTQQIKRLYCVLVDDPKDGEVIFAVASGVNDALLFQATSSNKKNVEIFLEIALKEVPEKNPRIVQFERD